MLDFLFIANGTSITVQSMIAINRVPWLARMSLPWKMHYRAQDSEVMSKKCYITPLGTCFWFWYLDHAGVDASGMILKLKLGGIQRQNLDGWKKNDLFWHWGGWRADIHLRWLSSILCIAFCHTMFALNWVTWTLPVIHTWQSTLSSTIRRITN